MSMTRRHFIVLTAAAAAAWDSILAGTPEAAPSYTASDHWYGMLINIEECIGCGSCVRGCQNENNVPDGYFRTWVERYQVADWTVENPTVDSPDGGKNGFPRAEGDRRQELLRSQTLQPLRRFALHPGVSGGSDLPSRPMA